MASGIEEASEEAREVFATFARRADSGERLDIEAAVAARPELASELRGLHEGWLRLGRLLGSIRVDSSVVTSIAEEAGGEDDPADPELGAILGRLASARPARDRYEIRERIAAGGMGEVYRVHDRDLGRDLAMKVLRTRRSGARDLRRFLAEARLSARLEHPGIVPVHDVGVDSDGRLWFTMPLVRGPTLERILERSRAEPEVSRARLLEILLRVCDTLAFAHASGVVHRDVKPSNVIVGEYGEVHLVDWGLARSPEDAEGAIGGEVVGTPAYMAPEQAAPERATRRRSTFEPGSPGPASDCGVDARADVYSAGAILYHVLSGRRPYGERSGWKEALEALRAGPPEPLEVPPVPIPPELAAICERAMARDPSARYGSVRELSQELRAWTEGRVVRTYERGAWAELKKWIARNKALSASLLGALALAVGGLAAVSWTEARAKAEILRLADVRRLEDLDLRAEALWPATPEKIPAMETWLADAETLLARLPRHARALEDRGRGSADAEERWRGDVQADLVARLARLGDPDPSKGRIADVRARLEFARTLRTRSLDEHAEDWRGAIASIRDPRESPAYGGLELAPELGLVPLGRDPRSGLWEFAHLASGEPATRGSDGQLVVRPGTGVVLVLVPGGTFDMGSELAVPGRRSDAGVDPLARENEAPVRGERVAPFFLSKFEMTRAQWRRALGERPTETFPGGDLPASDVSRSEAARILRHLGLELSDEIEWEYAARAGTRTRWWTGNDARALLSAENAGFGIDASFPYDDGWPDVAPAASLAANPWGFHHVLGNVAEWTASDAGAGLATVRGGSFRSSVRELRAASRSAVPAENRSSEIGLRPARALGSLSSE